MFKQLFQKWTEKDESQGLGKIYTTGKIGETFPRATKNCSLSPFSAVDRELLSAFLGRERLSH